MPDRAFAAALSFLGKDTAQLSLLWLILEGDHRVGITVQDRAQTFQCKHGNAFVMAQIVDSAGIDAIFIDQGIGGNSALLHCAPQSFIADQWFSP